MITVVLTGILAVGTVSAATVTQQITYQGKLTNAAGNPLTGTYTVVFSLYEVSTGGTALATTTRSVACTNGLFTTPAAFDQKYFDGRALWLGVKVGTDPEMTPRQEIRPVPYTLGLRPGAWITGSDEFPTLNLKSRGEGIALNISTTSETSHGVRANTYAHDSHALIGNTWGVNSIGVYAVTNGESSPGVLTYTYRESSQGVFSNTNGDYSEGVRSVTKGYQSTGVSILTEGAESNAVRAVTQGDDSYGVSTSTIGTGSFGFYGTTSGFHGTGLYIVTSGQQAPAVHAVAKGIQSNAVYGETTAAGPAAVAGWAHGADSYGVYAISDQGWGLYAHTGKADQKYGIYTPDYLYAKGTQVPSSDVAEFMPVAGEAIPGTVLVIGEDGRLRTTTTAYDTGIAGIVSTAPGVTLGAKEDGNPGEQVIAVAGRVPCRVDTSNGPIRPRDLLTTSANPGYAMKATDPKIGTVLGKALESLESGTGTIEVLVTLQ